MIQSIINDADDDIRLDRWFKRHHPGISHATLEMHLRKGLIRLDSKKAKSSERIRIGQVLSYSEEVAGQEVMAKPKRSYAASEQEMADIRKCVLYKDDAIIILNKPFGLAVQGGTKISRSLDDLLDGLVFDGERPKLVHRLDRDTSGVLVLARNAKMAAKLAKGFAEKTIEKTYLALVNGVPLARHGIIDFKLMKSMQGESSYERVAIDEEDGKYAETEYRVIESLVRRFALMELKPLTGRTHQLRVHMAAIGCPIVGDNKYGDRMDESNIVANRQLHLHARRILIPAAITGKKIEVSAALPSHMKQSFETLGIEVPKK